MARLLPHLSEQEDAVFHRGRNQGHGAHPKGATVGEYRNATGMEALFGYLYMMGESARIDELFAIAYKEDDKCE
jgi:ribonuclease-3 family protein